MKKTTAKFTTKVIVDGLTTSSLTEAEKNYNAGSQHRAEMLREINSNPIIYDKRRFVKNEAEKANLGIAKSNFKRDGLKEWNDRNRPGNNKN